MTVNSKVKKVVREEWLYNPREHPNSYSVIYSKIVGKYLLYKRGIWKMSNDILLCEEGAKMVCSILNKTN